MFNKVLFFVLFFISSFSIAKAEGPILVFNYEDAIYEQAIQEKNKNVLLIFGADWCPSCVRLKKDLLKLDLHDYIICQIDVDQRRDLAKKYNVNRYPTSIIINNKEEKSKIVGYSRFSYQKWLDKNK